MRPTKNSFSLLILGLIFVACQGGGKGGRPAPHSQPQPDPAAGAPVAPSAPQPGQPAPVDQPATAPGSATSPTPSDSPTSNVQAYSKDWEDNGGQPILNQIKNYGFYVRNFPMKYANSPDLKIPKKKGGTTVEMSAHLLTVIARPDYLKCYKLYSERKDNKCVDDHFHGCWAPMMTDDAAEMYFTFDSRGRLSFDMIFNQVEFGAKNIAYSYDSKKRTMGILPFITKSIVTNKDGNNEVRAVRISGDVTTSMLDRLYNDGLEGTQENLIYTLYDRVSETGRAKGFEIQNPIVLEFGTLDGRNFNPTGEVRVVGLFSALYPRTTITGLRTQNSSRSRVRPNSRTDSN